MASIRLPNSLEEARIPTLPDSAYYIPHFISSEEEQELLDQINTRPLRDWKVLSKRRLQAWPSALTNNKLMEAPLPRWLAYPIIPRLSSIMVTPPDEGKDRFDIFAQSHHGQPNHVLINEYPPGTGIMPHTDGPAYYPVVATVSLGASIILDVHEKASDGGLVRTPQYRILQEPRSLLITTDKLYTDYFHGISDAEKDDDLWSKTIANWEQLGNQDQFSGGSYRRETRVSLTFRDVPQVVKPSKLFPGLSAKGW